MIEACPLPRVIYAGGWKRLALIPVISEGIILIGLRKERQAHKTEKEHKTKGDQLLENPFPCPTCFDA